MSILTFSLARAIQGITEDRLPPEKGHESSMTADGELGAEALLLAALGDWVDFVLVPVPKPFVIYADHDEYTTFLASTKSNLNRVVQPLAAAGFQKVPDYERIL
jgi:hypothetical protein